MLLAYVQAHAGLEEAIVILNPSDLLYTLIEYLRGSLLQFIFSPPVRDIRFMQTAKKAARCRRSLSYHLYMMCI